jgi:very-short-patch-repair endonuclease
LAITQVTRRALSAAIESCGYWWAGDLNEVEFLSRLYPLDDLASTDPRFRTAREDITQHCIANCDWQGCWVLEDERFELVVSDERLLRFLAETVHPEVRADLDACRQLASMYNSHLRPDGVELAVKSYISGRPVFGPARASPPEVTPLKLQEAIAEVIWGMSATRVADYCEGLGLGPPRDSHDDPMSSKRAYVMGHTKGMSLIDLVEVGQKVLADFDDPVLRGLLDAAASSPGGVTGPLKNLIFAADGPKPELVLRDAINNDVEITRHAEHCLVYDRPLKSSGLTWRDLVEWWAASHPGPNERAVALELHRRLQKSLSPESPGESLVLNTYASLYGTEGFDVPALIPQVYLHFDPRARRSSGSPLIRQRMDFLMLLPKQRRVVIEVDGQQHYSENGVPSPSRYAAMMREDRNLRLAGYEVFRFGASELSCPTDARSTILRFFVELLQSHGIVVSSKSKLA